MADRTFLNQVKGFTPVIDVLAKELGTMTALVYGIVWRYCQMEDKVCRASKDTIAAHANIDAKTVQRHLHKLVERGYLEDTTPNLKHAPHVYKDAGKVQIIGLVEARLIGETESPTSEAARTKSLTSQDRESQLGRTESPVKIDSDETLQDRKKKSPKKIQFAFDERSRTTLEEMQDSLPPGFDAMQSAIDRANGGKSPNPAEQAALHHYWGHMGAPGMALPGGKRERMQWLKTGERLLGFISPPWDIRTVCARIDEWWNDPQLDEFWKGNPSGDKTLITLAKYIKNGKERTNSHARPIIDLDEDSKRIAAAFKARSRRAGGGT